MNDLSSISFSQCSQDDSPLVSKFPSIELNNILFKLGGTLEEVQELNEVNVDLYRTMADLVRQSQQKLKQIKIQNQQAHRKSLEHIEILLFQKDYREALQKIDQYKKMQLNDIYLENSIVLGLNTSKSMDGQLTFEQEKMIINNEYSDLALKQSIWLKYALDTEDGSEFLRHVTYEEVQESLLDHFRKQFDIMSQITQIAEQRNLATPQKKNSKSISYLKSSAKNQKSNNFSKIKEHQQSAGKIVSSKQRSSQKRTTRKKPNREPQESRTSKKLTPFIA